MTRHSYNAIYLHITWHTKENMRVIRNEVETMLYDYLRSRASETPGLRLLAVGGTDDHIHIAVKIPPTLHISEWVGQMKGASSHYVNDRLRAGLLYWQEGYGAVSFGQRALNDVVGYIENQRERHARGKIYKGMESI